MPPDTPFLPACLTVVTYAGIRQVRLCKLQTALPYVEDLPRDQRANPASTTSRESPLEQTFVGAIDPVTWTADQAAAYLKLRPRTVKAMAAQGLLPAIKLGKFWIFDENTLRARWRRG